MRDYSEPLEKEFSKEENAIQEKRLFPVTETVIYNRDDEGLRYVVKTSPVSDDHLSARIYIWNRDEQSFDDFFSVEQYGLVDSHSPSTMESLHRETIDMIKSTHRQELDLITGEYWSLR